MGKLYSAFSALDYSANQIAVLDRDGVIQHVNRSWREFGDLNGASYPDSVGTNYLTMCGTAAGAERPDAETFAVQFRKLIDGEVSSFNFVYPCHSPTQRRWFKVDARCTGDYVLVEHTDVTELYEQQRQSPGLRRVMHDVLSPLNAITGFSELGRERLRADPDNRTCTPEDVAEYFDLIHQAAERIQSLAQETLERGAEPLVGLDVDEVVDLSQVLSDTLEELRIIAEINDLKITADIKSPAQLRCHATGLWRCLHNVIGNAVKYNRPGGSVHVSLALNPSGGIEIEVTDTGRGMSRDFLRRLTAEHPEAGLRELVADAVNPAGYGLGVPQVRRFAAEHEALFELHSARGKGTTVQIIFPVWRSVFGKENRKGRVTHITDHKAPLRNVSE